MPAEPDRIGHYRIQRKLGEGGMGVVYEALDERLNRPVAVKMIRQSDSSEASRKRLWREARAAAAVNHPNVCQIYEIAEQDGELFLVMELLEGESLAAGVGRGPSPLSDAVRTELDILAALEALHRRDITHRDLKPSNVFQTPHGIKLLDFGLARPAQTAEPGAQTETALTVAGALAGTPHYMSPEQMQGKPGDARSDLFSAGAVLFEMLTGKRAFTGQSIAEVFHAVVYEQPPALSGSPAIEAVDLVIRKALEKNPQERFQSASSMAEDLRLALLVSGAEAAVSARAMTRVIVLPFRMLHPDPETDFLSFSLPDAITVSLSGLESLVVRSSIVASRFADPALDLKAIAAAADVDAVLTGTLLRAGEQLRVSAQFVDAPSGTLLWSHVSQLPLADVFQLQDDLVNRILDSLSPTLSAREQKRLKQDVPSTAKAYEFFLRANQLSQRPEELKTARDLYLRCLEEDSRYAPAWARLGRCYRVIGKFGDDSADHLARAEAAFQRALSLHPDLPLAHNLLAYVEAERGRALESMVRLLGRAQSQPHDPELFAGLVHVCRYCGLLGASLEAYRRARRLDPHIQTSVAHTYFMLGQYQEAVRDDAMTVNFMRGLALAALGRGAEALPELRRQERLSLPPLIRLLVGSLLALLEGRREESVEASNAVVAVFSDPEGIFYMALTQAYLGEKAGPLAMLRQTVDRGFYCYPAFEQMPWLAPLRGDAQFEAILGDARERHGRARAAFIEAGGEKVLGAAD